MALTDMYNVVHDMTLLGRNMLNVYQCERTSPIESAGSISDAFQNSVLPIIRLWQSDEVVNNELRIFNLGTSTDFGTFTLSGALGLRIGTDGPAFISGEVKFPSIDRAVRTGFKRFGGMLESDDSNGVLNGAAVTLLDNIGAAMIASWLATSDAHAVCNFVIIKRVCTTVPPPGDPCPQYRLPLTGDPLVFYQPNQRITVLSTRSQVSRRPPAT